MAKTPPKAPPAPEFDTEVANRLRDPYETNYMGVLRSNDPLLLERGGGTGQAFELYRDLKRDGKVFSGLQKRKLAVIGKTWQVESIEEGAAGDAAVEVVTQMLKQINFDTLCSELLDALLVGFVPAEIVWTIRDNMITAARVIKRAQRRFVYAQDDENAPPALRLLTRSNMLNGEPVPDRKFMVHRVNPEDDNPYGTGLGLQLYWPVFFKRKGILSWNKLNDRFGSPTPWGKYPKGAGAKEKGTLFDALKAMSNDGVIMTPEGMSLELLESKLTGSITTQQSLCEYMDDWIMEVILGQSPRGKGGGAVAAASNEREDVRVELSQADSDLLSETVNSTLLAWFCDYNGLSPCRVYRVIKKDEDLKAASETDKNVASMGFRPTLEAIQTKYGEGWEEAPAPTPTAAPVMPPPGTPPTAAKPDAKGDTKPASFAEQTVAGQPDPIDALVAAELAQWQPLVDPIAKTLQAALDDSAAKGETAAQFLARMPELLSQFDVDALSQALTRSTFTARLAGVAGLADA
jgi:phage gp29-like protein